MTKFTNLDELLGFSMPKRDGSGGTEQIDTSMQEILLAIPSGMKYQDVVALVTADGLPHSVPGLTVGDDDGDASLAANARVGGEMKATWYYAGTEITDLNKTLSDCGGPYTLKIELPTAVSANTMYGDPNTKFYGSDSATYTFLSPQICYLQPLDLRIHNGVEGISIQNSDGYNPLVWKYDSSFPIAERHRGFKADAGFPTTGFNKAVFNVIGSGIDQSKYRCSSSDDGGKIILSGVGSSSVGEKCKVTYNSASRAVFTAGETTPIINMEYNYGGAWIQMGSYPIPTPVLWARPVGKYAYNTANNFTGSYPAASACDSSFNQTGIAAQAAAGALFFTRTELTNSPYAVNGGVGGYYSRDLGTFMGEWGYIHSYTGSGWDSTYHYWSGEPASSIYQFVSAAYGGIIEQGPYNLAGITAVCRD